MKPVVYAPVGPGEPMPLPEINRLAYYESVTLDTNDLENKATLIEETLSSFKVEAHVREINPGPAVTQYTLEPGGGSRCDESPNCKTISRSPWRRRVSASKLRCRVWRASASRFRT